MTETVQPPKLGIDQAIIVAECIADLGNIGGKVWEDERIDENDLAQLLPLIPVIQKGAKINWKVVGAQFADLDPEESAAMISVLEKRFDIPQDAIEVKIEKGLKILVKIYDAVDEVIDYIKDWNKVAA